MENIMSSKPLLSISMLVSGREEMKKSLESLQYFKKAFPCEIILVDTGCNAEQRAFAETYSDMVIDFVWCDDFAAARNTGLKKAKGEWFLYLDDDEWFEEPKEIIAFFTSGEYKKYNSASYIVRSYRDMEGKMYSDEYMTRMVRLKAGVKFVGRIHEFLSPFAEPKKSFSDFVHHYGYVYQDKEAERRHGERNIIPLLKLRKEEPGNPRWMLQLAQEYCALGENEKAIETCKEGLNELREQGIKKENLMGVPVYLGAIYAYLLISLDNMGRYEEEEEWLEKALAEPVLLNVGYMKPSFAFYCMAGARMYAQTKKYEKCYEYFQKYIEYKERLENNRAIIEKGSVGIVSQAFQLHMLYGTVLLCMESLIHMGDEKLAEKAFYMLDWNDDRLLDQGKYEKRLLDACCHAEYRPLWTRFLQTLVSREGGMKEMYAVFLLAEMEYKQNGEIEQLLRLRQLVSELNYSHHYIVYTKILWKAQNAEAGQETDESKGEIEELFKKLFEEYQDKLLDIRGEVWDVAEKLNILIETMFLKINYRTWKDTLDEWNREASTESLRQWENRINRWRTVKDIRYGIFDIKCSESYLLHYQMEETKLSQWEEALWKYANSVLDFYRPLYKESVFEQCPEALPDEVWLALHLKKFQECREKRDDKEALSALRECIGISIILEKAIETYAEALKSDIQERNQEAEKAMLELNVLITSLKATAKLRMERKEYQVAKEILLQIQRCAPEDKEVEKLLKACDE